MRKMFWVLMVLVVLVFTMLGGMIWVGGQIWKQPTDASDAVSFTITPGESAREIAASLKEKGLIDSAWLFEVFVRYVKRDNRLQAGTYEISRGTGIAGLFITLRYGHKQTDAEVTIPEGYTLTQIGTLVESKLGFSDVDWQAATGVDSPFEDTLALLSDKPDDVDLEGYLFPDTYRFAQDATAEDVARIMLETMDQRLVEHADDLGDIIKTGNLHEVLTLASIVEREVMTDADRGNVADIFQKRLDIGMALQADSTVNYITGKKSPGISLDDKETDSPYNTYKYPGLPPGPISNPGIASIIAAAHPTPNPYYYFLTTEEGKVMYAETYDQHLANKALYR